MKFWFPVGHAGMNQLIAEEMKVMNAEMKALF
jgi:hypothetical protein